MICCFPDFYPDELLYSVAARYWDRMCFPGTEDVGIELFGVSHITAVVDLPGHLSYLMENLPPRHRYTLEVLIDNCTLLPFYQPFLSQERVARIRDGMCGSEDIHALRQLGILTSGISLPRWLQFCSLCVENDKKNFGECYWHRVHQIPGIKVCPTHEVVLQNSCARTRYARTRCEFMSAERAIQVTVKSVAEHIVPHYRRLIDIARDAAWLVNQPGITSDPEALHKKYLLLLADRDLATYSGRVRAQKLVQAFNNYYSPDLLALLECPLDESTGENWLLRLVRISDAVQHPLRHLLLIRFLGHTPESFFDLSIDRKLFGDCPWPCLNPVCNYYHQPHIQEYSLAYGRDVRGRPVGTFACECGFVYTRTGPDLSLDDRLRHSKVIRYGSIWEAMLRHLWEDENVSLKQIARQLKVDIQTIKHHGQRLSLPFPPPGSKTTQPMKETSSHFDQALVPFDAMVEDYRKAWLSNCTANQSASASTLRKQQRSVYTWLYRHDREWLGKHIPSRRKKVERSRSPALRLDWSDRDEQLADDVRCSATRIKGVTGRPIKVTVYEIARDTGQVALLTNLLGKLPLTKQALKEVLESHEDFAARRIYWVVEQFMQEGTYAKRWQIIKRAGIQHISTRPQVANALDIALELLERRVDSEQFSLSADLRKGFEEC